MLVHDGDAIVPAAEARVPFLDHGFLFGDSIYDVVRTAGPRPFMWREHLDRLRASGRRLHFELPWSDAEIRARVDALLAALGDGEWYVRLVATRGVGPVALSPAGCGAPRLYLLGMTLPRVPASWLRDGCRVALVARLRTDARALDPRAKTGNYLNNMLGQVDARAAGADEAIFLNAAGRVTESSTSNVFWVEDGRLRTPPVAAGLLAGVTRRWLLEVWDGDASETDADADRLRAADEIFLTGTVKGVVPATTLDGAPVGDGRPGPHTRRAQALYDDALARHARS